MLVNVGALCIATGLLKKINNLCIWEKLACLCGVLLKKWSREDPNLVWKGSYQRAAVEFGFVFSLHEESQQLPFPFDKNGPPPNEAKAILFQDVVAVLHHLRAE